MIDFDDNIESVEDESAIDLTDLKRYADSPRDYLNNYYEKYRNAKKNFLDGNFNDKGNFDINKFTSKFVYSFKEFLRLDWEKIAKKLIDSGNLAVCFFFAYLQINGILEKEDFDSDVFKKYLEFLGNSDETSSRIKKSSKDIKDNFKIYECQDSLDDFISIEKSDAGKKYCLVSMPEDASVRCSEKIYKSSDLKKCILILDEIEVKAIIDDEFIYFEVN